MKRKLALAMVLAMAMTTMGSATVFADDASDDAAGNDYTIAYVPTTMNNPFWTAMLGGIKEEMEAKGMDVDSQLVTVDANSDQATMNNYVNDLIAQEVDAIILAPMDCTAVTEALQACEDAGIPVINVDTAVDASDKVVSIIASDNYKAGVLCAKEMMKQKDHANIVLLTHNAARSAVDRINGFTDTIKKNKNYKILASADTQGQIERALPKVDKIIEKYKNIDVVMGLNDPAAMGALAALDSKGAREGVLVYGIDGSPEGKKLIKEGMMTGTAAQSPKQMADTAINAAYKILQGKKVEKKKVISVQMITKKNVEQTDISRWQ